MDAPWAGDSRTVDGTQIIWRGGKYLNPTGILEQVDVVRLRLHLEFDAESVLPPGFSLQLRRELLQVGRLLLDRESFCRLFEPSLPADPMAIRRFQRPAPAFILKAGTMEEKIVCSGEDWQMEVLFVGDGIPFIPDFIRVVQQLGQNGLYQGRGRFVLIAASSLGVSGEVAELSLTSRAGTAQVPHMFPLAWLVETTRGAGNWRLEMMTPARLVSHGKPLFHPDLPQLFPYILRRVGAMLWHWGGCTNEIDPQPLLAAAARVVVPDNRLFWQDWKPLPGIPGVGGLGGISGTMVLSGPALDDIFWILGLGAVLHVGKGAAYGAGEYRLTGAEN